MNVVGVKQSDGNFIINPGRDTPLDDACKLFVLGTADQLRTMNRILGIQPLRVDPQIHTLLLQVMKRLSSFVLALPRLWASAQSSIDDSINAVMEPVTNAIMKVIFFTVPVGGGMEVPLC